MTILIHPDQLETTQAIMEGKLVNSHQTEAWRETMRRRQARLRGEDPSPKTQTAFFTVPPPPVAVRWDIEWRWNKDRLLTRIGERYPDGTLEEVIAELDAFAGDNPWQRHRNPRYHSINSWSYGVDCLDRLKAEFPGKEFRMEVVKWREVAEPEVL